MALTSTIALDLVNQTQTLTYFEGASQIDQITFSSNSVTFGNTSGFNLSKSDLILYNNLFQIWFTALVLNFPTISITSLVKLQLSNFQISITSLGITHINYIQSSLGSVVNTINYVPVAIAASFSARSTISISLQELYLMQDLLQKFTNQVAFN